MRRDNAAIGTHGIIDMGVRCSRCKFEFPYSRFHAGREMECPFCRSFNVIPLDDPGNADSLSCNSVAAISFSDLQISPTLTCVCPHCKEAVSVEDFYPPDERCPYCLDRLSGRDLRKCSKLSDHTIDIDANEREMSVTEYKRWLIEKRKHEKATEMAKSIPVAAWMLEEFLRRDGFLEQRQAVEYIRSHFGDAFVYLNDNGNLAIIKPALDGFRKLTRDIAVWCKDGQFWRERRPEDDTQKRLGS